MQIGGLKTIVVQEGCEHQFESLFRELREAIRGGEPDCLYYSLLKSRTNPRAYIVENSIVMKRPSMRISRRRMERRTSQNFARFSKLSMWNIST